MGVHPHLMSGQVTPKPAQTSQRAQNKQKSNCFFLVIRSLGFTLGSFGKNLALFWFNFRVTLIEAKEGLSSENDSVKLSKKN